MNQNRRTKKTNLLSSTQHWTSYTKKKQAQTSSSKVHQPNDPKQTQNRANPKRTKSPKTDSSGKTSVWANPRNLQAPAQSPQSDELRVPDRNPGVEHPFDPDRKGCARHLNDRLRQNCCISSTADAGHFQVLRSVTLGLATGGATSDPSSFCPHANWRFSATTCSWS